MDSYLSHAQQLLSSQDASNSSSRCFSQLITLAPHIHKALQDDLKHRRQSELSSDAIYKRIRNSAGILADEALRNRIAQVLEAFLGYVAQHPPIQHFTSAATTAEASLPPLQEWISAHHAYAQLFSRSATLFTHPTSPPSFQRAFRFISSNFLTLSIRTDLLSHPGKGGGKWERLTDCTSRLAGPVRAAGMDRSAGIEESETKRAAVMWLGNDCLRGYFKLNNLKLCETVIKSIQEALSRNSPGHAAQDSSDSAYPMSDRVRYRYYLGRVRLSQGRVRVAFDHLSWALKHCYCPSQGSAPPPPQVRRILLHLLPTALILGLRPTASVWHLLSTYSPDLINLYGPLFDAFARPSLGEFERLMAERDRKEYLRKLGVWLLIREKAVIGIWRGIVKRYLLLSLPPTFAGSNAPPTLSIAQIHRALPFFLSPSSVSPPGSASGTTTSDVDVNVYSQVDIECIVASLVDQGYIKGYTFHSKGLVVFQKGDKMGFAPVSTVY